MLLQIIMVESIALIDAANVSQPLSKLVLSFAVAKVVIFQQNRAKKHNNISPNVQHFFFIFGQTYYFLYLCGRMCSII